VTTGEIERILADLTWPEAFLGAVVVLGFVAVMYILFGRG
jgi:hypothetical protein